MTDRAFGRRIGIVGGGQLGLMLARSAGRLGLETVVLDPDPACPASALAGQVLEGRLDDPDALARLTATADVSTFEIEHIAAEPLVRAAAAGAVIAPSPGVLATIQDKLAQKRYLADHGLPTSRFEAMDSASAAAVQAFGYPCVQKLRRGGYDGQGVKVCKGPADAARLLEGPSLLEGFVDCAMEIAVVVARRAGGEVASYPVVEMTFTDDNVLDVLVAPARIDAALAGAARELAEATVTALDGVGVFGVELFVDHDQALWVNEVAPRVHNSGHFTTEACVTSQFEQHLRAICDLPLGDTTQHAAAVMVNLLGAPGSAAGPAQLHGYAALMAIPGASLHWYGKRESRAGRKMGHVTVTGASVDEALARAVRVKQAVRVAGDSPA